MSYTAHAHTQYAGEQATRNGCKCGGHYSLIQQTFGFSRDDNSMADFLCYKCKDCGTLKFVTIPQRQYTELAKIERQRLGVE